MAQRNYSLRKKILLLAVLPALAVSLMLALLVWNSSRRASGVVRSNVTDFMVARTQRSLHHGYASSEVTANYLEQGLRLNMNIAQLILGSTGGVSVGGAPVPVSLIGDAQHV